MQHLIIPIFQHPHYKDLPLPEAATAQSAGVDLLAAIEEDITLQPGARHLVATGISIILPQGFEAQIRPRSGLAAKHGVTILNAPGTIDADYRGEIKAILINHGQEPFTITRGMRVCQLLVAPVQTIKWRAVPQAYLDHTERGDGGFGSTGTNVAVGA